jgi:fatty acid desaturase
MADDRSVRTLVQELTRDRKNHALAGILSTHVFLWGALAALYVERTWPVAAAAFVVIGVMQYRLVMSCHEAVHKTLVFPLGLNEFFGVFHGALTGLNFIRYRRQHLDHHRAETLAVDPDGYIYAPILAAPAGWRRAVVWIAGVPAEILEKFRQKGLGSGEDPATARKARFHSLCMLAVQGVLFCGLTWAFGWYGYFALWLLPILIVPLFLNRTRIMIEHGYAHAGRGARVTDRAATRVETIDLTSYALESFVMAPYAFNFHGVHHTYPSVPHYHLHKVAADARYLESRPGMMVRASYATALRRVLFGH